LESTVAPTEDTNFGFEETEAEADALDRDIRYHTGYEFEWRTKSCPEMCRCTINDLREKKVNCEHADLTKRRQPIPMDLTILIVKNSTFDLQKISIMRDYVTKLEIVDTEYNAVSNVDFDGFDHLDELTISGADLTEISQDAFEDIKSLRTLDLSHNDLVKIPAAIFVNLTQLETIVLQNNSLEILDKDTFARMPNLRTLNLIDTGIEDFHPEITVGNTQLETLWLDQNLLVDVPDLRHLASLEMVRLSNNPIEFFKQNDFYQMKHLKSVTADEMAFLIAIEPRAFADLPALRDVSISYSPMLSFIHPLAFLNCPNIRTLTLAGNALFTLGDLRPALPNLRVLNLEQVVYTVDLRTYIWNINLEFPKYQKTLNISKKSFVFFEFFRFIALKIC